MASLLSASVLRDSVSYVGAVLMLASTSWTASRTAVLLTPLALPAGLTPFLVKLLDDEDLTAKQALHLLDLQLREQVTTVYRGHTVCIQ